MARFSTSNNMRARLFIAMVVGLGAGIGWDLWHLADASVRNHSRYAAMANDNQFGSTTVKAARGSIFDANGKILAQSATVYNIIIAPGVLNSNLQVSSEERDRQIQTLVTILNEEIGDSLSMTSDEIRDCFYNADTAEKKWIKIASKVERPQIDAVKARAKDEKLLANLVYSEQDTRRYYPQGSMAASVIGFTNYEGDGIYGVEAYYNDYLAGVDGKIISAKDGNGNELPYSEGEVYQSKDGDSLYLTLDMTLQYYLETELESCVRTNNVQERACAIIMNAKTGAILAMASAPGFDLNDRNTIYSEKSKNDLKQFRADNPDDEEGYEALYAQLREAQWKNKAVTEPYEPGSVFKVVTGSAALEEKAIDLETPLYCNGGIHVIDRDIACWTKGDHGKQNFVQAMTNSCNPAFVQIGQRLGISKFQQYYKAFGFKEKTGIDLPGESQGLYVSEEDMGLVELASCSFGQSNTVTPIQMITAYTAVINGGYLLHPHVMERIVDSNGNIIKTEDTTPRRQVISEDVSATMRDVLEKVVNGNGGGNAYIKGYRIGGKSGTGQKLEKTRQTGNANLYVSSYVGFAPANDPEIVVLCMVDEPYSYDANGNLVYYGSMVAAPVVANVLKKALPELGYYPEYNETELAELDVSVPDVTSSLLTEAEEKLEKQEFMTSVIGKGDVVMAQYPTHTSAVPKGSTIFLYTDDEYEIKYTTVPDIVGCSASEAKRSIRDAGLNFKSGDGAQAKSGATAYAQNYDPGEEVPVGTVIEVTFIVRSEG
ncbi:MAG: PASTA domain-containing protein [Oscillospiraceae bacterium]|nr:PASTA domain-containing protein [Oscillospiraceae bacterium]